MPVLQQYYTSYYDEISGRIGLGIKATSPGISSRLQKEINKLISYRIPPSLDERAISTHPVALRYWYNNPGESIFLCSQSIGSDVNGRPGNFFAHTVVMEPDMFASSPPILYWNSPFWQTKDTESRSRIDSLPVLASFNVEPSFDIEGIWDFLAQGNRQAWLYKLLCAVVHCNKTYRRILIQDSTENVVWWIAIVSSLLPPDYRPLLSFSTYHHNPMLSPFMITGVHKDAPLGNYNSYFVLNAWEGQCSEVADSLYARVVTDTAHPDSFVEQLLPLLTFAKRFPKPTVIDEQLDMVMLYAKIQTGRASVALSPEDLKAIQLAVQSIEQLPDLAPDETGELNPLDELEHLRGVLRGNLQRQQSPAVVALYQRIEQLLKKQSANVVMKALSQEPKERFESITAFAEALERAATGKGADGIGKLFGPYRTARLLGQGDMGMVYFAEGSIQQSDGTWHKQSVAVKVLHNWYDKDKFRSHVRKLTQLQHSNILHTREYDVKDGSPYLVMDYAHRKTLLDRHPRGTVLPLETILSYVKQIASALQYAHERDMLGDVRPKKMFVGQDNRILMSGFDIALNVGAEPGRMGAKDYFEYRAPEQTQVFLSAACNQYALGIMVYEWLCGDVPFQGESVQIVYQHKRVTPPSLREKNAAIPHEVEEVVMKALAKDPEQRYESIQEFAEALEEAILPPKAERFVLPDRSGEQFGKYILVRRLGQGGFAEVYLGQHSTLKKNFVAIKILYAHLSAKQLEGLDTEAQIIAGMQHPSIVRVIDIDIERNIRYLVMDYAPKGTMRQFHARGSRLSLPTVVKYVKQIADALQHAHDQKIIHRDVKPENMLIGANGTIMLSDFGLAMIAHNTKSWKEQDRAGTAKYMAPEQYRRKAIPASDQYSLAVTAYEWLCGAPPFYEGEDDIQLVLQHLQDPIPPMSERGAVVSEEVEKVILKALAKEPAERFGSVKEFAEALEKAAQVE